MRSCGFKSHLPHKNIGSSERMTLYFYAEGDRTHVGSVSQAGGTAGGGDRNKGLDIRHGLRDKGDLL